MTTPATIVRLRWNVVGFLDGIGDIRFPTRFPMCFIRSSCLCTCSSMTALARSETSPMRTCPSHFEEYIPLKSRLLLGLLKAQLGCLRDTVAHQMPSCCLSQSVFNHRAQSVKVALGLSGLKLMRFFRMSTERLPRCALIFEAGRIWQMAIGGQSMIQEKCMRTYLLDQLRAGPVRLPGWGSGGPPERWLETTGNMHRHRSQWGSYIRTISSSTWFVKLFTLRLFFH